MRLAVARPASRRLTAPGCARRRCSITSLTDACHQRQGQSERHTDSTTHGQGQSARHTDRVSQHDTRTRPVSTTHGHGQSARHTDRASQHDTRMDNDTLWISGIDPSSVSTSRIDTFILETSSHTGKIGTTTPGDQTWSVPTVGRLVNCTSSHGYAVFGL